MPTFDFDDLTEITESDPRRGDYDTLQWHHTVTTSYGAARDLMSAGGRTVSANGLMTADGRLARVVDLSRRAFTSASVFDHRSLTVECVNTSGGPEYGLSDATHRRLGKTLSEMVREGRSQLIYGPGGLLQHKDVPGSYATACAGPSADSDRVLAYAREYMTPKRLGTADMQYISPATEWAKRPNARIITDFRNKELVTDPVRVAALDYSATRTNGLRYEIYAEAEWNRVLNLPDFADVKLTDSQLAKIGAAVKVDLAAAIEAVKAIPDAVLARFRSFWTSGK